MRLKEKFEKVVFKKAKIKKISASLLLLFSLTQAKADFTTKLVTNPAYSFFPGNVFHSIIWDDEEINRNPKLKKTINASKKILSKYIKDNEKLKKLNIEYLKLILKLYEKNNSINVLNFLDKILKLGEENNLTIHENVDILRDYIKQGFIPKSYLELFKKEVGFKLKGLINFYGEEKFYEKIKKVENLYKNNELSKQKVMEIFKEYIKNEKDLIMIYTFLVLGLAGAFLFTLIEIGN